MTQQRIVIIGAGAGGLAAALHLAPLPVTVLTQSPLGQQAATGWAQGGIAAAMGHDDLPSLHAADTEAAGAGLVDSIVARRVAESGPACIEHLLSIGTPFDRKDGELALGLEAAHGRRRIVHAGGDGTGREVLAALTRAVLATASVEVMEGARAVQLAVHDGAVCGVWISRNQQLQFIPARAVILATGGLGALYSRTTNPAGATGSGIALAARAGAVLRDMEFVQFHPTAILTAATGFAPMPLATEALRGEGAWLVNAQGERIMADIPGAELAPRDVVARAVERRVLAGEAVFLDSRQSIGAAFAARFPSVAALCQGAGIDPVKQPIPVRPAAHYHMGGVKIDLRGRSSVAGLWACGEVSASGLHGANRLASNSLLEALAFARWIAEDIAGQGALAAATLRAIRTVGNLNNVATSTADTPAFSFASLANDAGIKQVRATMTRHVGVTRDGEGLHAALEQLAPAARAALRVDPAPLSAASLAADMALVGSMIALAALQRLESRGAQCRSDFPRPDAGWQHSIDLTLDDVRARLHELNPRRAHVFNGAAAAL